VRASVPCLHYVHLGKFREDDLQQSAALQIDESLAGDIGHEYLVQFLGDALSADYLYPFRVSLQRIEGLILNPEIETGGETDAAEHTERVVAEGDVRVERRADDAVIEVVYSSEGIHEFSEAALVETDSHGIDGEVTAVLVVFQCAVLHYRIARFAVVAFLSRSHEFHFDGSFFHFIDRKG